MVVARRAKVRPARIVVSLVAAAALLTGGIFAASRIGSESTASSKAPVASPVAATSPSAVVTPTKVTSPPATKKTSAPSPDKSPASVNSAAANALKACQKRVQAADEVLAAAKTGVSHWAKHVQAQADRDDNKISAGQMKNMFAMTRVAGPDDQRRYSSALADYDKAKGSCGQVKGAAPAVSIQLDQCQARSKAQQPVMKAGANGMADWKSHLADMKRSASEYVPNAKQVWLDAAAAAPPNINAYKKAADSFDAPSC